MVASDGVDSDCNWVASRSDSYTSTDELTRELRTIINSGEQVVVRASSEIAPLIKEFGLIHLASEWTTVGNES